MLLELIKLMDQGLLHLKPPMIMQNLVADIRSLGVERSAVLESLDIQLRSIQTAAPPHSKLAPHLRDLDGDDSIFRHFILKTYPATRSYKDLVSELSFCDESEFPILDLSPSTLTTTLSVEDINNFIYLNATDPELKLRPISINIILRTIYKNHCLQNNFLGSSLSYENSVADFFRKNKFHPIVECNIKAKLLSSSYRAEFAAATEKEEMEAGFSFGFGYNNDNLAKDLAEIDVNALALVFYLNDSPIVALDGRNIILSSKRKIGKLPPALGLNIRYLADNRIELYVEDPILAKHNNFKDYCQRSLESYRDLTAPDVAKGKGVGKSKTEKERKPEDKKKGARAAEKVAKAEKIKALQLKIEEDKKRKDEEKEAKRITQEAKRIAQEAKAAEEAMNEAVRIEALQLRTKEERNERKKKKKQEKKREKAMLAQASSSLPSALDETLESDIKPAAEELVEKFDTTHSTSATSEATSTPLLSIEVRKIQLQQASKTALIARKAMSFNPYSITVIPRPLSEFLETLKTKKEVSKIMLYGGFLYARNPKDMDFQVVFSDEFIATFLNDDLSGTQGILGLRAFLESILPEEIRDLIEISHHSPSKTYKMKIGDLIDITFIGESQYLSSQNWTSTIDAKYYDCRSSRIEFHPSFLEKYPPESWEESIAPFVINSEAREVYFRVVYVILPNVLNLSDHEQIKLIQDLTAAACKDFDHKPLEFIEAINFFKEHHKMTEYENILFNHSISSILNLASTNRIFFSEEEAKNLTSFASEASEALARYYHPPSPSTSTVPLKNSSPLQKASVARAPVS